ANGGRLAFHPDTVPMLNYLWAGLIIASFAWAIGEDLYSGVSGRYDPGGPVAVAVEGSSATIDLAAFGQAGTVTGAVDGDAVVFSGELPVPLDDMVDDDGEVRATLADGMITFEPVRFVRLRAIQAAAFDMAETGATLAIGLVGLLALWLGLVKIGEASGMINAVVWLVRPLLGRLFPQVPRDHPALGLVALNLAANVLGLGNAATPLGIKAMESLQELNPTDDTATDPMVMLLALNTASVTLVPPVTLIAIMGLEAAKLTLPIIVTTGLSLIIAIAAAKLYGMLPAVRRSDPGTKNVQRAEVAS
ncbi:MAG: nucleoside recognition domain-containing protein, partial [Planctomycetota bacterium]